VVDIVSALDHVGSGGRFDEDQIVFSLLAQVHGTTQYVYFLAIGVYS